MVPPRRSRTKPAGRVQELLAAPGQTIAAGEFKAKCLKLMDLVNVRHEEIVITKHGKPVAKLVPVEPKPASAFGALKGSVLWYGDLISPMDDEWDVDRE